jgi:membrane-bound serine protease (ClpP class)
MNDDSSRAFLGLILGMLAVFAELVFPGLVLPGVSGLVVVMLSISYFTGQAMCSHGVVLLGLTALLLYLDGWLATSGLLTGPAAVSMMLGARLLMSAPEKRVRWYAAAASFPFCAITAALLRLVLQAQANKSILR